MKLKVDEKGNVVLEGGMPVWVHDDGKEAAIDVPQLLNDLKTVNGESKGRRKEIEDLNAKLATFEGIDPVKAKTALETVANLDAGSLVTAGKVEELKGQIAKSYESRMADIETKYRKDLDDATGKITAQDQRIRHMLVRGIFDQSKFLSDNTVLPPDVAFDSFGKHFEVEDDGGNFRIVAKLNGEPIFSRSNPGKHADPEEAIETIIGQYQFKDRILRAPGGGAGTPPGSGGGAGSKTMTRAAFEQLPHAQRAAAIQEGVTITN